MSKKYPPPRRGSLLDNLLAGICHWQNFKDDSVEVDKKWRKIVGSISKYHAHQRISWKTVYWYTCKFSEKSCT